MAEARFATGDPVDFVIVGSGAAGGVLAKEFSTGGFDVVLLEQGPFLRAGDFRHDELACIFNEELTGGWEGKSPQTFRKTGKDKAELRDFPPPAIYAAGRSLTGCSSIP